jgi:4-hydroxybenzoate polyprenyltransferase
MVFFMLKRNKYIKFIVSEFIYGGHFLSLGAVSLVFASAILLKIRITLDCLVIIYFGTQVVYLYNRFKEIRTDFLTNPERSQHIRKYLNYLPLIIFFYLSSFIGMLVYFSRPYVLIFTLFLLLFGLLYSKFFKSFTKKIICFKGLFVAFAWSLLLLFLIFYYSYSPNIAFVLIFFFVFLRLFFHENFADIKDIEGDKKNKLITLPIIIGSNRVIIFLKLINFISVTPLLIGVFFRIIPPSSIFLLLVVLYSFYLLNIIKNNQKNNNFIYDILADGEYILWPVCVIIGEYLLC